MKGQILQDIACTKKVLGTEESPLLGSTRRRSYTAFPLLTEPPLLACIFNYMEFLGKVVYGL